MGRLGSLLICVAAITIGMCAVRADTVVLKADPTSGVIYANPVWSPDGRSIAYVSVPAAQKESIQADGSKDLYLATLRNGAWQHRLLLKGADWPVWSPDGRRLAVNHGGLALLDVRSGSIRRLSKGVAAPNSVSTSADRPISWSPSGKYLLQAIGSREPAEARIVDTSTGRSLPRQSSDYSVSEHAFWLSDRSLLATIGRDRGAAGPDTALAIVDVTTGRWTTVRKGLYGLSLFAPRGSDYAWAWVRESAPSGQGIYWAGLKSGKICKLLSVGALEWYWSPDGKQFAFIGRASERTGETPNYILYRGNTHNWFYTSLAKGVLPPDGHPDNRTRYVSWSPDSRSVAYVTGDGDILVARAGG